MTRGVRAAIVTVLPILAAAIFRQPLLTWTALGGWLAAIGDPGGTYRDRATAIGELALVGSIALFVGMLVAPHTALALVFVATWCFACSLARAWSTAASTVGTLASILGVLAIAQRTSLHVAGLSVAFFVLGVCESLVLALLLWPLHPHRPLRIRTAECVRTLTAYVTQVEWYARTEPDAEESTWTDLELRAPRRVREAIEDARAIGIRTRAERPGPSPHGDALRTTVEACEALFGVSLAMLGALERDHVTGDAARAPREVIAALRAYLEALAPAIEQGRAAPDPATVTSVIRAALADVEGDAPRVLPHWIPMLERAEVLVRGMADTTDALRERPGRAPLRAPEALEPETRPPFVVTLREALAPGSVVRAHALRVAAVTAVAVVVARLLPFSRGYWITLSTLIVLQPSPATTFERTMQRIAGTVAGGVIAAALAASLRSPYAIAAAMIPLSIVGVAMRPLSYGLFTLFITPVFVLLAERTPGDWHLAGLRALHTAIGGVIAIAGATLFWPRWERETFGAAIADLVDANRVYLLLVADIWLGKKPHDSAALRRARRRVGLANNHAEDSFGRMLGEPDADPGRCAAIASLLTLSRRLPRAIVTWGAQHRDGMAPIESTEVFVATVDRDLAAMRDALRADHAAPGALAVHATERTAYPEAGGSAAPGAMQRIGEIVELMRASVGRAVG